MMRIGVAPDSLLAGSHPKRKADEIVIKMKLRFITFIIE
jgi:hypothetical protein